MKLGYPITHLRISTNQFKGATLTTNDKFKTSVSCKSWQPHSGREIDNFLSKFYLKDTVSMLLITAGQWKRCVGLFKTKWGWAYLHNNARPHAAHGYTGTAPVLHVGSCAVYTR